ncbi:MAG: hypothetical protein EOO16_18800 [Chitinophagaceae bacterium]|nr:MAG: hypothetical protein EOO16_18800 [Chitinophagaceae bacterium]
MKKQLLLLAFSAALTLGASAQANTAATPAASKTTLSKEEKAKQKEQQERDLSEALQAAGLTDAQSQSVRAVLDASNAASKELKANTSLTEEQKAEAKLKINAEKNTKLKDIMGAENFKKWNEARKQQKARAEAAGPKAEGGR